jgi:hypothetical protein
MGGCTEPGSLLAQDAFELVHVLDPRFPRRRVAAAAPWRARHRDAVPAPLLAVALARLAPPLARSTKRSPGKSSQRSPAGAGLPLSLVRPAARELPWPSARDVARRARASGRRPAGRRRAVAADRNDFAFRDLVCRNSSSSALPLFGEQQARGRFMLHAAGTQSDFPCSAARHRQLISAIARTSMPSRCP